MIAELENSLRRLRRFLSRNFWVERLLGPRRRDRDRPGVLLVEAAEVERLLDLIPYGYKLHSLEREEDTPAFEASPEPSLSPVLRALWHLPAVFTAVSSQLLDWRTPWLKRWRSELELSRIELSLCLGRRVIRTGRVGRRGTRRLLRAIGRARSRHYRLWIYRGSPENVACLPSWLKLPDSPLTQSILEEFAWLYTNEAEPLEQVVARPPEAGQLRVMVYNVHGCVGMDGRRSISRIAQVIASYAPHVVALQEVDRGRKRSDGSDQAAELARRLEMDHHFHAAMELREGEYGNAVLARVPTRLVQAQLLPRPGLIYKEPRGAMWLEVEFEGRTVQLINTHLGLVRAERLEQLQNLLGPDWLQACPDPVVLCGDFNAGPAGPEYALISKAMRDCQHPEPAKTWFGRYPMRVLDYLFTRGALQVESVLVPRNSLTVEASDHLPLVVDLSWQSGQERTL